MKKRKLRGYVIPTIYIFALGIMALGITVLSKNLLESQRENDEHYNYTMSVFNETEDVINQEEEAKEEIEIKVSKPYTSDSVSVAKDFYNKDAEAENQENALIYYENTYMPNTGILYQSDEVFDVVSILDGKVKSIKKDEILGTVLTVESNHITAVYYTSGEVKVNEGDTVLQNDIIATSGTTKLETQKQQTLLFETYINGILTNPNTLFEKNISDLN